MSVISPPEVICFDQPWGSLIWLASREIGNSTTMTFGRVVIAADQENPRHCHPNCDEILHLLSGRIEHCLGEQRFVLQAAIPFPFPPASGTMRRHLMVEMQKW